MKAHRPKKRKSKINYIPVLYGLKQLNKTITENAEILYKEKIISEENLNSEEPRVLGSGDSNKYLKTKLNKDGQIVLENLINVKKLNRNLKNFFPLFSTLSLSYRLFLKSFSLKLKKILFLDLSFLM